MRVVADTNAWMRSLNTVAEYSVIIPIAVLEELDKHKGDSGEVGFNSREAIKYIEENNLPIDPINLLHDSLKEWNWIESNDNYIISSALRRGCSLLTGDIQMTAKARLAGLEVIKTATDVKQNGIYTGVREVTIGESSKDQSLLAACYEYQNENVLNMFTNEYVIFKKPNGDLIDTLKYNGKSLVALQVPGNRGAKKSFTPLIKPKNAHQLCAIDLLNNPDIPIRFICGTYGSGKTWLATRMGLYHIKQSGLYSKLMVVRNPVASGEEIGFLPGDKMEKIGWAFKQIEDQLEGGKFELESMLQKETVEFEVPMFLKGRSLNGGYSVLVDEAEDLDLQTLKMIGTRLGEGSSVTFCGDWRQSEKKFRRDNGLLQAIEALKGNPLVGVVVLQEDVRSEASKVFADME